MLRIILLCASMFLLVLLAASARADSPLAAQVNSRIRAALSEFPIAGVIVPVPLAPAPAPGVAVQGKPAPLLTRIHDVFFPPPAGDLAAVLCPATVWENLTATTDWGGHVSSPGPRGDWHTRPTDPYVALPDKQYLGWHVLVRSHRTGKIVEFPVYDTGPWSTADSFIVEARRPWAESGRTNMRCYRGQVPGRGPAIDLSPAAWRALGEHPGSNRYAAENYAGQIDLIVPISVIRREDVN